MSTFMPVIPSRADGEGPHKLAEGLPPIARLNQSPDFASRLGTLRGAAGSREVLCRLRGSE